MDFLRKHLPTSAGQYVERYLKGIQFPIRKEELVSRLEANGVPGAVVSQVRKRLPEGEYRGRSEEHTSELQSRQYLVCRLLLEKKKKYTFIQSKICTLLYLL